MGVQLDVMASEVDGVQSAVEEVACATERVCDDLEGNRNFEGESQVLEEGKVEVGDIEEGGEDEFR